MTTTLLWFNFSIVLLHGYEFAKYNSMWAVLLKWSGLGIENRAKAHDMQPHRIEITNDSPTRCEVYILNPIHAKNEGH